jgi:transcriptional regulator with XRE-family HTH domain
VKELGRRIKKRRLALGLSLQTVAAAASRSHGWLYSIEQGTGNPKAESLTAVAIALGDDPREYLRLAGRVALTAADFAPMATPSVPVGVASAIADAVAEELRPLLERLDRLIGRLEVGQDAR